MLVISTHLYSKMSQMLCFHLDTWAGGGWGWGWGEDESHPLLPLKEEQEGETLFISISLLPCHTSRVPPPTTLGTPGQAPLGSGTSFPPLPKGSLGSKCTSSKKSTSKNKLSHSALALGSAPAGLLTDRHCVRGSQRKPLPLGAESSSAALELHPAPVGNKTCSESHPQPDRSSCQTPALSPRKPSGLHGASRRGAASDS